MKKSAPAGTLFLLLSYLFLYNLKHINKISVRLTAFINNPIHGECAFNKLRIIYLIIENIPCIKLSCNISLFWNNSNFHTFTFSSSFPIVGSWYQ